MDRLSFFFYRSYNLNTRNLCSLEHKFKCRKTPCPPSNLLRKSCLAMGRGGVRGPRARGRASGWMSAGRWAPSCCRRPISGTAPGALSAGDQHNSWQHREWPESGVLQHLALREQWAVCQRGMFCPGRASVCIHACPAQRASSFSARSVFPHRHAWCTEQRAHTW
jgi:hypothetical protein